MSVLPPSARKKAKRVDIPDEKCIKIGDLVLLSSVEEDERAYLSISSVKGEEVLVVQPTQQNKKHTFEIYPMIYNAAQKALQKLLEKEASPEEIKRWQEKAEREKQQNEAMHSQVEGTPIRYGQILQLCHPESGSRFASGSTSEAALLEQSCAKLFLRHNTGKKCWFKFLPLDERVSEGDKIPIGTPVAIVHANSDLFIHRSSWVDEQGDFEANLSPIATHWVVDLYDIGRKTLKAGAFIRLHHQKAGYLGGNISFDEVEGGSSQRGKDVFFHHILQNEKDQPIESTNTIWVVELEHSAGSIAYLDRVRFNLWGFDRYLAFPSDPSQNRAFLTNKSSLLNLFLFHKNDRKDTNKVVSLNSTITLQHAQTGAWMKGVPLLEDSKHWAVECFPKANQSEVIRVVPVLQEQVTLIEFLEKRRSDIFHFVTALKKKQKIRKIPPITNSLIELILWVMDPPPPRENPLIEVGKPIEERQQLLGSPGMLELLVGLLRIPFEEGYNNFTILETDPKFRFQCELVYGLLARTAKGQPKVSARLFKYVDVFSSQVSTGLAVYTLLEEVFRDSKAVCQMVEPEQLESFIGVMTGDRGGREDLDRLVKGTWGRSNSSRDRIRREERMKMNRSADFLDFLSTLCVCEGGPIPNNQDTICENLLLKTPDYFLSSRVEGGKVLIQINDGEEMFFDDFLWTADKALVQFHASSLHLFHCLCFGRNSSSIQEVRNLISGEEALFGLMCKDLPFSLRTAYCNILHYVYLDCHPNKHEKIRTVYAAKEGGKWEEGRGGEERGEGGGGEGAEGGEGEGGVEIELERLRGGSSSEGSETHPLIQTNGSERNSHYNPSSHISPKNQVDWMIFIDFFENMLKNIKHTSSYLSEFMLSLLKLLKNILSFGIYSVFVDSGVIKELTKTLRIHLDVGRGEMSNDFGIMLEIKIEICKILETIFLHSLHRRLTAVAAKCKKSEEQPLKIVEDQIAAERRTMAYGTKKINKSLEIVLLSLLRHRDTELSSLAMRILIGSQSRYIAAYENITKKMRFLQTDQELFVHQKVIEDCVPFINQACDSLVTCDLTEVERKIRELVDMCVIHKRRNYSPNEENQDLLAHLGAHRAVLRLLENMPKSVREGLGKRGGGGGGGGGHDLVAFRSIYTGCYIFLSMFCNSNPRNQTLLFPSLPLFISHVGLGISAVGALIATFKDNDALCRKLPHHVIASMLGFVKQGAKQAIKPLKFLQVVAMPEQTANRAIQSLILKQIVAQKAKFCPFLGQDSAVALIEKSNSEEPRDQDLVDYYVEIVNTLSACSFGKSHTAEAMCQNLLSLSFLFDTLNGTRNFALHTAFVRFLDEVWFHTEIVQPQIMFIQTNEKFWDAMSMFYQQLMNYCDFLRASEGKGKRKPPFVRDQGTSGNYKITPANVGLWTKYLCDQLIPLLEHYYDEHFKRDSARRMQIEITGDIFDALCTMLQTKLAHKPRIDRIASCVGAMIHKGLVDTQRERRFNDILNQKLSAIANSPRSKGWGEGAKKGGGKGWKKGTQPKELNLADEDGEYDAHAISLFRLTERDVPQVFGEISQLLGSREALDYASILARIIKDMTIEDMELKLSCLRLLRYIAWNGELEDIRDEESWKKLKIRQNHLASYDLVPSSLALLGPGKDDEDICTEALDLALVLTYKNKPVRDALMDYYFDIPEEFIWADLRTLIQNSIAHIRKQKNSRNNIKVSELMTITKVGQFRTSVSAFFNTSVAKKAGVKAYHPQYPCPEVGTFPQLPYTQMIFRFMQSLCIDHDERVQKYFHEQDDNFQNVDLVRESAVYLRMIDDFANPDTIGDIRQCIVFMQDLAIGSRDNQFNLVSYGVCESLEMLLRRNILPNNPEKELELQVKVTELLLTLLEGNTETTIPTTMINALHFPTLVYHAQYLQDNNMRDEEGVKKRKMDLAKNTFRLIKMLGETDQSKVSDNLQDDLGKAFSTINSTAQSSIGRIEVIDSDRSIQRLYFPIPQSCQRLRTNEMYDELMNHFSLDGVNWQSNTERVEAFCRWSEGCLIKLEQERRRGTENIFIRKRNLLIWVALLIAVILNILIIAFADTRKGFRDHMEIVLRVFGGVELILALLIFYGHYKVELPVYHYTKWKDRYNSLEEKTELHSSILFTFAERDDHIQECLPYLRPRQAPNSVKYALYCLWDFLNDFGIDGALYQLAYILFACLGIAVHPFFFCFLLLDVIRLSRSLQTILLTIYLIGWTLLFIGLLIMSFVWIFSLYVFIFIPEAFDPTIGQYCDYPLQCLISLSHIGISFAGAPKEFVKIAPWDDIGSFMGTVIFDILFYVMVGMILFNIIFAVIVDKFGQLRDTRAFMKADWESRCFICSIEREVFQRVISEKNIGIQQTAGKKVFLDHVTFDHRPWDYIFFFEYLKLKTDPMTSNEEQILRHIQHARWLAFMPLGRAKILESGEDEKETSVEERLEILTKTATSLARLVNRLQTKIDNLLAKKTKKSKKEPPLDSFYRDYSHSEGRKKELELRLELTPSPRGRGEDL